MVHLELRLRLKIKHLIAVGQISLKRILEKRTPKIKPSFIRHHFLNGTQFNAANSKI